jgi:lysylphosphatidylglycerol synthetase-like protein (DUF2156 family)
MDRLGRVVSAIALVGAPLLLLAYFVTFPAYGEIHGDDIARAVSADPGTTRVADVFAFAGAFLAVPATLAYMRLLRPSSPKLATLGGGTALTGWMALVGVLMTDVVATEIGGHVALFADVYSSPIVVGLSAVTSLHVVGSVLIGVALMRTRLVARPLAVAFTVAAPTHLAANLAGQLWLDAITWLVTAATSAVVAAHLFRDASETPETQPRPVLRAVLRLRSVQPARMSWRESADAAIADVGGQR